VTSRLRDGAGRENTRLGVPEPLTRFQRVKVLTVTSRGRVDHGTASLVSVVWFPFTSYLLTTSPPVSGGALQDTSACVSVHVTSTAVTGEGSTGPNSAVRTGSDTPKTLDSVTSKQEGPEEAVRIPVDGVGVGRRGQPPRVYELGAYGVAGVDLHRRRVLSKGRARELGGLRDRPATETELSCCSLARASSPDALVTSTSEKLGRVDTRESAWCLESCLALVLTTTLPSDTWRDTMSVVTPCGPPATEAM
jgi:hypothetical protein